MAPDPLPWLLEGDPAIRWQAQRDLLGKTGRAWQAERARTANLGWGADLLARQDADGGWGGGVYSPKWTSTTYTLLTLCDIGFPGDDDAARRGAAHAVDALLGERVDDSFNRKLADLDRCIVGMMLRIGAYFGIDSGRIEAIVDNLLGEKRREDGCWRIQAKYGGRVFFDMEKGGVPSRWNTLRALRVLGWWGEGPATAGEGQVRTSTPRSPKRGAAASK